MADVLTVAGLKAYYQTNYFGVRREVRAVDDISIAVRADEVYGIAGESSSGQDHADQDLRRRHPSAAAHRRRLHAVPVRRR